MTDWTQQLQTAEEHLATGHATNAFRSAFGALEICFDLVAQKLAPSTARVRDDRFIETARTLQKNKLLRDDEFALVKHLADARNLVSHKYGFEPSVEEARRTIQRIRLLCGRFARKVCDAMQKPVVTAKPDEPVGNFINYFVSFGYSLIPVVEGQKIIGTLNDSVVLKAWQDGDGLLDPLTPVRKLMSTATIPVISPNATVEEARKTMIGKRASALLVLTGGLPVGILTKFDLLNHIDVLP